MMMMQRLLQNNNNNNPNNPNNNNNNNNNNGYADEMRLNGSIRHHSASPFSKPAAVQAAAPDSCGGEPDALTGRNEPQLQPVAPQFACTGGTAAAAVQAGPTCTTVVTVAAADDRLTSDEDDELNVDELNVDELNADEDPVDLTNNRLHGGGRVGHGLLHRDGAAGQLQQAGSAAAVVPMDTAAAANDYETSGGGACAGGGANSKGRLAFSVENILDPNKFTRKLMAPSAVLPRWRPRVDFVADPPGTGNNDTRPPHIVPPRYHHSHG
ncbi:homeobox protein slou [Aphis craccivora]|uniref:Homeobox protein slou n=1 Tax=Aphis craccivora TaxID=307492 RepID=A0A6G0YUF7_APHCR|nr:homeobox protein slou [Aphis craccivora]